MVVLGREPDGAQHLQRPLTDPPAVATGQGFEDGVVQGGERREPLNRLMGQSRDRCRVDAG